jgi:hypothetical protein
MKRQKIELKPALKASNFKENELIKATVFIKEINDVETKFGDKTIITFDDGDSVFMNAMSNNLLVDKYGQDDKLWINKAVKLTCEKDAMFDKLMLVVTPIA